MDIHDGQLLRKHVNLIVRNKKIFYTEMGFKSYPSVTQYYSQKHIKKTTLHRFLKVLRMTEDEFYGANEAPKNLPQKPDDKPHQGQALSMLIDKRGIEKSWLVKHLGISRPTLDRYIKSEKIPIDVADQIVAMFNLPGNYFENPRVSDTSSLVDMDKKLDLILKALDRVENRLARKNV